MKSKKFFCITQTKLSWIVYPAIKSKEKHICLCKINTQCKLGRLLYKWILWDNSVSIDILIIYFLAIRHISPHFYHFKVSQIGLGDSWMSIMSLLLILEYKYPTKLTVK